jgi:peroxiredoxin
MYSQKADYVKKQKEYELQVQLLDDKRKVVLDMFEMLKDNRNMIIEDFEVIVDKKEKLAQQEEELINSIK